mgnify:CR=1 FL=1
MFSHVFIGISAFDRAFAFYAALCASAVLLHPILVDPWAWGGLRVAVMTTVSLARPNTTVLLVDTCA